ncbi:MAG: HpcH/HpaI aldolase/citrate lyase family protein [Eubacteriales bacterium]|nr:HpcH/HpaI aldolase/citrate lyase family protein [Eubacteriales bacterium]
MKNNALYYSVGALLYCPANKNSIADSVISERFGKKYSLALCLEDTINDAFVAEAEQDLIASLNKIYESYQTKEFYLPKIFIRVRRPEQICRLAMALGQGIRAVAGFILPKFSLENAKAYISEMIRVNEKIDQKLYMMPIYESESIIDLRYRADTLYQLKDHLAAAEELVLNIRVGGNDLCNNFGFRRESTESIHRIRPIADLFSDIVTVYGRDYVISGPVWEYYAGENWDKGLADEIHDDRLCGFVGKTAIHPNQIPVINRGYQISEENYRDAKAVLGWNQQNAEFVSGSHAKKRMNEYKTHQNWARQTIWLAEAFGTIAEQ